MEQATADDFIYLMTRQSLFLQPRQIEGLTKIINSLISEDDINTYVLVCRACGNCGGVESVGLFKEIPTEGQIDETKELIGGMWCITHKIYKLKIGEITEHRIEQHTSKEGE